MSVKSTGKFFSLASQNKPGSELRPRSVKTQHEFLSAYNAAVTLKEKQQLSKDEGP